MNFGLIPQKRRVVMTNRKISVLFLVGFLIWSNAFSAVLAVELQRGIHKRQEEVAFARRVHSSRFFEATVATNPSLEEVSSYAEEVSTNYGLPCLVTKSVMFLGSGWRQFDPEGQPLISPSGRVGIMMVAVEQPESQSGSGAIGDLAELDVERLKSDWRYNLRVGVQQLLQKRSALVGGHSDPTLFGNWAEALAHYDGFEAGGANDPWNPGYSRDVERNRDLIDSSRFPYQECILNILTGAYRLPEAYRPFFTEEDPSALRDIAPGPNSPRARPEVGTSASSIHLAATSTVGWASETGYRYAETNLQRAIIAGARAAIGNSPQSTVNEAWETDTAGGDGDRMRSAIRRYDQWYKANPRTETLAQVQQKMIGDFDNPRYTLSSKQQLVQRIIAVYNNAAARPPVRLPVMDNETLLFLGIRAQCVEFAKRVVLPLGGRNWTYQSAGLADSGNYRPGMILLMPSVPHAAIIVDIYWNASGKPEKARLIESNWGNVWSNPPGQRPWERTVSQRETSLPTGAIVFKCDNGTTPPNCNATVASDRWKGEYFNNVGLSGTPVMVRDDSSSSTPFFAHDWGTGSPSASCGVNSDNFSARWTRRQYFDAGQYRFTLRTDDGVRLYVDDVLRLDRWYDQGATNHSVDLTLSAGQHNLRVEYYERGGGAVAQIYWERTGGGSTTPTISGYSFDRTPRPSQPFNGTISGSNFVVGGTQVFLCNTSSGACYQHSAAGVTVNSSSSLSVSNVNLGAGSWQIYVQTSAGASARSSTFTVQQAPPQAPTISNYSWDRTPRANESFNGTITGSNFVVGNTQVFFCNTSTGACYQQPSAGVNVTSATSLNVNNVNLGAGSYQIYLQTPGGSSSRSSSFTVQAPQPQPPTISGYSFDRTPRAGQPFNGTITGTGFVVGGTRVFFCNTSTGSCYEHSSAGVTVNNSMSLNINNVNLGAGSYQIYVQTSAGSSSRSTAFNVQSPQPQPPTISNYSWDRTPRAGQPFNGTISGSNFVVGGTQVFLCVNGSSTCYQHPAAGVSVNNSSSLNINNVNLGAGSYQILLQTSAGSSARSWAFTVQ
jgi:PA14 domain-containing protein